MKKLTILILIIHVLTFALHTASRYQNKARNTYSKVVRKYIKYNKYRKKSRQIDNQMNTVLSYIKNSRRALARNRFKHSLRLSNRAMDILETVEKRVKSGGFFLTKRRVMDRLLYVQNNFTMMKKYKIRSNDVQDLFTQTKEKIKFARMLIREDKIRKANSLIKQAMKILFKIPSMYKKVLEKETIAQRKIFQAVVFSIFTSRYYVTGSETKGEFRRVRYFIHKARERYQMMDYEGVSRNTKRAHEKMKSVQELNKKIAKRNEKEKQKCRDANLAIQFANSLRRNNSQNIKGKAIYDTFYLARQYLSRASNLYKQGQCSDANKAAVKSLNLLYKIRRMRKSLIMGRNEVLRLLKKATGLMNKAKKMRLPFDAEEQLNEAKSEINDAKGLIKGADYAMAKTKLKAAVMRLKSLTR